MSHSTFDTAKTIRRVILTKAAESMNYRNWSTAFVGSEIKEIPVIIKNSEWFYPINPSDLTENEMIELGFSKWSEEDPMYLIPFWLFHFLAEELECGCIDGEKRKFNKSEMDNDHRFGCMAYGIMPKK